MPESVKVVGEGPITKAGVVKTLMELASDPDLELFKLFELDPPPRGKEDDIIYYNDTHKVYADGYNFTSIEVYANDPDSNASILDMTWTDDIDALRKKLFYPDDYCDLGDCFVGYRQFDNQETPGKMLIAHKRVCRTVPLMQVGSFLASVYSHHDTTLKLFVPDPSQYDATLYTPVGMYVGSDNDFDPDPTTGNVVLKCCCYLKMGAMQVPFSATRREEAMDHINRDNAVDATGGVKLKPTVDFADDGEEFVSNTWKPECHGGFCGRSSEGGLNEYFFDDDRNYTQMVEDPDTSDLTRDFSLRLHFRALPAFLWLMLGTNDQLGIATTPYNANPSKNEKANALWQGWIGRFNEELVSKSSDWKALGVCDNDTPKEGEEH